jgi:hypothetical protein
MVGKVCGMSDEAITKDIFGVDGWETFRKAMKVRDRLAHPKDPGALLVTDEELNQCKESVNWFVRSFQLTWKAHQELTARRQAGVSDPAPSEPPGAGS